MTVYGSLSNVAVTPDWIYLIGGYRNIYYREPLVTCALSPSLLPLHERLPALLHAWEIRGVLHEVDMMLDDAPQNVCDPCCGELQGAQDHEEAVDAPDGENRRACEGDIEHGHELRQDDAQHHAHGAAPHQTLVAEVTPQEIPQALRQFARLPQGAQERENRRAFPLQPRIQARVQMLDRFGQRREAAEAVQPVLNLQTLAETSAQEAPYIEIDLSHVLHDVLDGKIRQAQRHIDEEAQQDDFQKEQHAAQEESQHIVTHIDIRPLPYRPRLTAQLLQKLHLLQHLPLTLQD